MAPGGIPAWNAQGVIPPIDVTSPTSSNRSPYVVSLNDVVLRFGVTAERRAILAGLLGYRAALHAVGLSQGFQWLDGSFLEYVELLESRPPNDIDVVTFFRLPPGETQISLRQRSLAMAPNDPFDRPAVKGIYHVDGYWVVLDEPAERIVEHTAYWYSVWSHRRSSAWKGFSYQSCLALPYTTRSRSGRGRRGTAGAAVGGGVGGGG